MTAERCFLTTAYDRPDDRPDSAGTAAGELPVIVAGGQDPVLRVTEEFVRGIAIVGRAVDSPAVLGLRAGPAGRPVRIRLDLEWDLHTAGRWDRHTDPAVPREAAAHPRLILVRAQHSLRQAALLTAPHENRIPRSTICIDLASEEIPADGLLLLELWGALEGPVELPPDVAAALAPNATIGIAIPRIELGEPMPRAAVEYGDNGRTSEREGIVSLGGLDPAEREHPGPRWLRSDLIVVNPSERALRLRLKEPKPDAPAPTRKTGLRRLSTAAGARLSTAAGARRATPTTPTTADRTPRDPRPSAVLLGSGRGAAVRVEHRKRGCDLIVPASAEPTLIVLRDGYRTAHRPKLVSCVPEH